MSTPTRKLAAIMAADVAGYRDPVMPALGHEGTFQPLILMSALPLKAAENWQKADVDRPVSA